MCGRPALSSISESGRGHTPLNGRAAATAAPRRRCATIHATTPRRPQERLNKPSSCHVGGLVSNMSPGTRKRRRCWSLANPGAALQVHLSTRRNLFCLYCWRASGDRPMDIPRWSVRHGCARPRAEFWRREDPRRAPLRKRRRCRQFARQHQ